MAVKRYKFLPGISQLPHNRGVINRPINGIVHLPEEWFDRYIGKFLEKLPDISTLPVPPVPPVGAPEPGAEMKVETQNVETEVKTEEKPEYFFDKKKKK